MSGQADGRFLFQNSLSPAAGYGPIVYKGSYQVITSINVTLEGIASFSAANFSSLTTADQHSLLYAEGENRFLRAMVYYNLVNIFGKPYYLASGGDLAVAIKKTGSATEIPSKSSVKDVYAYIVAELRAAAQLMKAPVAGTNAFASTAACWALLSRVYLYMGGSVANPDPSANQLVVSYADSVTDQSNGLYALAQGATYSNMFGDDSRGQLGKSKTFSSNPEIVFCKDNSTGGTVIDILYHFSRMRALAGPFCLHRTCCPSMLRMMCGEVFLWSIPPRALPRARSGIA
ncbi:RagB/SusD family nutrient uptake outer membrane protein [Puia sp. P3]|uniref:RagB/SusD family nutrient uptake outer membrane protein n=1 Tax=Puia sp. P3 TaxID=3423952 RepID=UPI003D66A1AD